jgi:hypothetical protein
MDLFDTLTWVEILEKTTFLGTPTLTVLCEQYLHIAVFLQDNHVICHDNQHHHWIPGKNVQVIQSAIHDQVNF